MLEKLPTSIKEELLIEIGFVNKTNFKLLAFFPNRELLIRLISMKINSIVIDNGTSLILAGATPGDLEQRYIYHFKDGLAKFYLEFHKEEYTLALSNVQRTIGQYQFVTGLAYSYSCKSVDLCILSRIANADLHDAINENGMKVKMF